MQSCDINNEMCQYLEDLRDSENQYFPHDQYVRLQNRSCLRSQSKCNWERQMGMEQSPKKVTDMASDSTLQTIFRKPPLVEFGCIIKELFRKYMERPLNHSSVLQLHICKRPRFHPARQPQLVTQDACGWMERQVGEPSCLTVSQVSRTFAKT